MSTALASYGETMAVSQRPLAANPSNPAWYRNVWVSCCRMGRLASTGLPEPSQTSNAPAPDGLAHSEARQFARGVEFWGCPDSRERLWLDPAAVRQGQGVGFASTGGT